MHDMTASPTAQRKISTDRTNRGGGSHSGNGKDWPHDPLRE
ncbi:MAG: hypothetical protein WAM90_05605 [Rhodanobacter sp.]